MGGASILGGVLGGKGAKKAAKAEVKLGREALALQDRQFQQTRADFAPWREVGGQAIGDAYGMTQPGYDHTTSPGYQFRFSEGQRAVESGAASKGMLMSGGTMKDLLRFGDGVASADYGDQFNRLSTLAGMGSAATSATAAAGSNYANASSGILQGIGQAKASGYAGQNQAMQGTLGNLINIYGMSQGYNPFGGY
jgi:hypothetical protein